MSDVCSLLHQTVRKLPRFKVGFVASDIPRNGIYFLFEIGEQAHGGERIVRVGTHTGDCNLPKRLMEHLYTKNKDRSVFRKHIGRCLLRRDNHPYTEKWEYDLTKKADRAKYENTIDMDVQRGVEDSVTDYMSRHFSFAVIQINEKKDRLHHEKRLISTLSACDDTKASNDWLGKWHTNPRISKTGLWNVQGHGGEISFPAEITQLFNL